MKSMQLGIGSTHTSCSVMAGGGRITLAVIMAGCGCVLTSTKSAVEGKASVSLANRRARELRGSAAVEGDGLCRRERMMVLSGRNNDNNKHPL